MLGQVLVTKQTGEDGKPVNTLLMVERVFIRRELYISIMLDRQTCGPLIVASQAGGTSIEDVAKATPEKIFKVSPLSISVSMSCVLSPPPHPTTCLPRQSRVMLFSF